MGHRHLFRIPQMSENGHDQNWNQMHLGQIYMHSARASAACTVPILYPVENRSVDEVHFSSNWNPKTRPSSYSSSSNHVEMQRYQPVVLGPSHVPFVHPLTSWNFCIAPESYRYHAYSSSYQRLTFHGNEDVCVDHTMTSGRGSYKRKNLGRYCNGGSSFSHNMYSASRQYNPSYRANTLSIRSEGSSRNVRSRTTLTTTHLPINPPHHPYTSSHPINSQNVIDSSRRNFTGLTRERNQVHVPPIHGRAAVSETNCLRHETNHFSGRSTNIRRYHHDFNPRLNPVSQQNWQGTSSYHSIRGVRSNHIHRSTPYFRASSSINFHMGQFGMSENGMHLVTDNYSRSSRSLPVEWRNGEHNERSRIPHDRYQHYSSSDTLMLVDHTSLYEPGNVFDQHRDMRMDVDNMSYEELIALGESIGNVNTGLSKDLMLKCLTENHSSPKQIHETSCAICLEDYEDVNEIGILKSCRHSYHADCIKKWLSIKNMCPICKASAVPECNEKET